MQSWKKFLKRRRKEAPAEERCSAASDCDGHGKDPTARGEGRKATHLRMLNSLGSLKVAELKTILEERPCSIKRRLIQPEVLYLTSFLPHSVFTVV